MKLQQFPILIGLTWLEFGLVAMNQHSTNPDLQFYTCILISSLFTCMLSLNQRLAFRIVNSRVGAPSPTRRKYKVIHVHGIEPGSTDLKSNALPTKPCHLSFDSRLRYSIITTRPRICRSQTIDGNSAKRPKGKTQQTLVGNVSQVTRSNT